MKYKVLSNIRHDGQDFAAGQSIELDSEVAKPLLESGALGRGGSAKDNDDSGSDAPTPPSGDSSDEEEPKITWGKTRLLETARARGLSVEDTMTRQEIYRVLKPQEA